MIINFLLKLKKTISLLFLLIYVFINAPQNHNMLIFSKLALCNFNPFIYG